VPFVRCKVYTPGAHDEGSGWQKVNVDTHGAGTVVFTAWRPTSWRKFRVATVNNSAILQENFLREDGEPVELDAGDTMTLDFVVHLYAFRLRINDDLDEEDEAVVRLIRMQKNLRQTPARTGD
jgi:hypothetical protein